MTRQGLLTLLKLLLAAALIAFVVREAGWDKISDTLSRMDVSQWTLGAGVMFVGFSVSVLRWQVLMRSVGLDSTAWQAYRLGFIGVFFNNVVPGLTGGDLVKAYYIARDHPQQRAHAVLTVLVDRLIGIVALAVIAAVVIPFDLAAYGDIAAATYGFLAVALLGGAVALSRRIKRRLRALLGGTGAANDAAADEERPGLGARLRALVSKVDEAVSMYRSRLGVIGIALLMSIVVHMCIIVGIWIFGGAIASGGFASGELDAAVAAEYEHLDQLGLDVFCSILPIVQIVSALPIAPAGWGVGEAAFVYAFGQVGVASALAVSLSFTFRLTQVLISLVGGVFFLMDRRRIMQATSA